VSARAKAKEKWRSEPTVPAAPLAVAVWRMAARESLTDICERAEIVERVVNRWTRGEAQGRVALSVADQVMTKLGLFWWEIWTEDTVREPLFEVFTYKHYVKKYKTGEYKPQRVRDRTIPYGDLGTDFWALREITNLMTAADLDEDVAA
jgi:hypothetical protein